MNIRGVALIVGLLIASRSSTAQEQKVTGNFCNDPKLAAPGPAYQTKNIEKTPDKTAHLPAVRQTVEQALKCYQAMSQEKDPLQPKGLPKISSAVMDFKTTTGKTVGFTFSIFLFKMGAAGRKD